MSRSSFAADAAHPPAPATPPGPSITGLFASRRARTLLTPLLRGDAYDALVSELTIYAQRHPEVLKCTGESILAGVADGLRWGLIFGETVYLVPVDEPVLDATGQPLERREWRARAIRHWRGDIEMLTRAGVVRDMHAQCVYRNEMDTFVVRQGTNPDVQHIEMLDHAKRGRLVGGYCVAQITSYHKKVLWMTVAEINEIRQKHSQLFSDGRLKPWYVRKTLIKQMADRLPRNVKVDRMRALFADEERFQRSPVIPAVIAADPTTEHLDEPSQAPIEREPARDVNEPQIGVIPGLR